MYFVIFLIVTSLAGCFMHPLVNEPKCHSKYDYDEKLLSKLIRMEMAMENVLDKFEENDRQSALAIALMRQATDDMSNSFKAQKEAAKKTLEAAADKSTAASELAVAEMRQASKEIENKLKTQKAAAEKSLEAAADKSTAASELAVAELRQAALEIENNLKVQKTVAEKSLEAALEKLETAVSAIQQRDETSSVVFHVQGVNGRPTRNHVIKFLNVVENAGGAYSLFTGCFTAPVHGVYWFSANICAKSGHEITPSIYIRGTLVGRVLVLDGSFGSCGSVSAVSTLQKNDEVCLKSGPQQASSPLWKNNYYSFDNFMGTLIN